MIKRAPIPSHQREPRLLLVEDHVEFAEATAEFLGGLGLEVCTAQSGREVLETGVVFRPDIIVCDMNLPDMSGLDAARACRAKPETKNAVFAITTALSETDVRAFRQNVESREVDL